MARPPLYQADATRVERRGPLRRRLPLALALVVGVTLIGALLGNGLPWAAGRRPPLAAGGEGGGAGGDQVADVRRSLEGAPAGGGDSGEGAGRRQVAAGGQGANVRQGPGPREPVVALLPDGTEVSMLASRPGEGGEVWQQVRTPGGAEGWIRQDLLAESGPPSAPEGPGPSAATSPRPGPMDAPVSDEPAATVASFYLAVGRHRFDQAVELWSPAMRAAFPPAENLEARFSGTVGIEPRQIRTLAVDPQGGTATVAVELVETLADGSAPRTWVGSWGLVRGATGWLLDQPNLRPG